MGNLKFRILVALVVIAFGLFMFQEIRSKPPNNPLIVMTYNVGMPNSMVPDMKRVAELIGGIGPLDILLLQEVPGV
jgi:endonuclease/exonuclease/phosphatase family metal-dependent hydrolase